MDTLFFGIAQPNDMVSVKGRFRKAVSSNRGRCNSIPGKEDKL